MNQIKILEVRSEIGAGTRGASLGPEAIHIAALDFGTPFFKQFPPELIETENQLLLEPAKNPFARRINGVLRTWEKVAASVKKVLDENDFPVVLAGDHSSAGGTIAGIKMAFPEQRIGVIWMDAHADIHSPYTTPSGNMHGMPLAASLNEDNLANKVNNPDEKVVDRWNSLKNIGGIAPKIRYEDLVFVTMRDMEPQEELLINQHKVRNFTTDEINTLGTDKVAREMLSALDGCEKIYISFDVDCMDSSISKGTGTPMPNGITEKQAANLILRLMQSEKVCCFEIAEVNPTLDKENLMAENAFEILQRVTNQLLINLSDEDA